MSMHRELNPQLFGTQSAPERIGQPVDPQRPATGIMGRGGRVDAPPSATDIKDLEHLVNAMKLAVSQGDKKHETLAAKVDEFARGVHGRLERFSQAILKLEEMINQNAHDTTGRISAIFAKVTERKVTDQKVHEMIDRHNMVIRNFENRLTSLQRVMTEQEMALHNATAALEEARAEIQKLKR
jgi:methyl-accepting chemotaxis protein